MYLSHRSTRKYLHAVLLILVRFIVALLGAMSVSGAAHAAVTGTVLAWGYNAYGQTDVPPGLRDVIAIDAAKTHTVALKRDGTVVAWGNNHYGQVSVPAGLRDIIAIGAGETHTVALKRDGTVVAWGWNRYDQVRVPAGLGGVMAIAAGGYYAMALKRDGRVVAWGDNSAGQTNIPIGLHGVRAIASGYAHTVVLKRDGTVLAWGLNNYGQTNVPAQLSDVSAIAAGNLDTVALQSSYRFGGFVAPVNAEPTVNALKAGAGVPVKFSLGGNRGLAILASGYPVSQSVACWPDARTDEIEQTVQADHSRLGYDVDAGIYTYVWKTSESWAGQCRRLVLRFADGIEHTALFRFR